LEAELMRKQSVSGSRIDEKLILSFEAGLMKKNQYKWKPDW